MNPEQDRGKDWLKLLAAPDSLSLLSEASSELILKVNEAISANKIVDQSGRLVEQPLESGLLQTEQSLLFPIRQGIVIMILESAIPLEVNRISN